MSKRVTMIGSANIDFIMQLPHLPQKGESVTEGVFRQMYGGKGLNQALAARRAGAPVTPVVSLGDDSFGQNILATCLKEGMDDTAVVLHPDSPCGTAMIYIDENSDNTIGIAMGANALLSVEQVEKAESAIAESGILMLQMEIPDEPMIRAVELAKRHDAEVMLNYAPFRKSSLALDENIAILIVNETEAGWLTQSRVESVEEAEKAAVRLLEKGHRLVVVTLGKNGSILADKDGIRRNPAFKIEAVDATAAGDTFCGALAAALVEGMELDAAARLASAAGALCASRLGAQASIPRREEIETFMKS